MSVGNVTAFHNEVAKPGWSREQNFGKTPEIRVFAKFSIFGHDV